MFWPPRPVPFDVDIPSYLRILSSSAREIGLNFFAFISGFVLYYQNKKSQTFWQFSWKKVLRIVLPCIIFALLYWLVFPEQMLSIFPAPVNGTHLWFLPVIFLCIMISSAHFFLPKPFWIIIALYAIICKIGSYVNVRTIDEFRFYFLIFYSGFGLNYLLSNSEQSIKNITENLQIFSSRYGIRIGLMLLILSAPLYVIWITLAPSPTQIIPIVLICVGSFSIIEPIVQKKCVTDSLVSIIDRNSFAIYLIHQFIINTWCTIGWTFVNSVPLYISIPIVFLSTALISLLIAETYGQLKQFLVYGKVKK